jgi:hypothetical protein
MFRTSVTFVPLRSAVRGKGAVHLQYILLFKMHSNLHLLYSALRSAFCVLRSVLFRQRSNPGSGSRGSSG